MPQKRVQKKQKKQLMKLPSKFFAAEYYEREFKRLPFFVVFAILATVFEMNGFDYYINSETGSDNNSGKNPKAAWKSIEKVNSTIFEPGSKIFFSGGQSFEGNLFLDSKISGQKGKEIVISSYGVGRAQIKAGFGTGIKLYKNAYITIRNINIVGAGRKDGNNGSGIEAIQTENLKIDAVEVKGFRIAGIRTGGDKNTSMTNIYAYDNGGAGIEVCGWNENLSENICISDCIAENNPGDPEKKDNHSGNGIVVGNLKKGLIEYCLAFNNGWDMPREGNGPVGIWGWNSENLTIQYCISHDNKSSGADGGGFDLDGGCRNSILQYNLSFNNQGPGYLLCQYPGAPEWKNNIVFRNISFNDGLKNTKSGIHVWDGGGNFSTALIFENIIVNEVYAVSSTHDVDGLIYRNNIFVSGAELLFGTMSKSKFENNIYWQTVKGKFAFYSGNEFVNFEQWAKDSGQEFYKGALLGSYQNPQLKIPDLEELRKLKPKELKKMPWFKYGGGN